MDAALQTAIGELLLGSIPTIIILVLLWVAYRVLVHKPLVATLAERHSRTQGAVAKAQADIAAADARTAEYEAQLREARMALYKSQETRRKQLIDARTTAMAEARKAAESRVKAAVAEIQKDAAAAKAGLQSQGDALAQDVIKAILRSGSAQSPAAGGQ